MSVKSYPRAVWSGAGIGTTQGDNSDPMTKTSEDEITRMSA